MDLATICTCFKIVHPSSISAKVASIVTKHFIILNELFKAVTAKCRDWGFFKYFNHTCFKI